MKFIIESINIWLKNGMRRDLFFLKNKVNVITGNSGTGKSAIFQILDYCFFASQHQISESKINENVEWYGLRFTINEKDFLLARRSPRGNSVSQDYYFTNFPSPLPETVQENIAEADLKNIICGEFSIDEKVVFPFGGRAVRAGAKMSPRYFFLFNTISEDIITSKDTYFDKQSQDRYREALPRIFDLALGIDTVKNIIFREKKQKLEYERTALERKQERASSKFDLYQRESSEIARKAIAYGLTNENWASDPIFAIKSAIESGFSDQSDWKGKHDEISEKIFVLNRKIRLLQRLHKEYKIYKEVLTESQDSVTPLEVLRTKSNEIVRTEHFLGLIQDLNIDLQRIKLAISRKNPVDAQVSQLRTKYLTERELLVKELATLPVSPESLKSEREKWLFIGELKGRLSIFAEEDKMSAISYESELEEYNVSINSIPVEDVEERKEAAIRIIEKEASRYLQIAGDALDNYAKYESIFAYSEKRIRLRKPGSLTFENVGSSSNHMFLHLAQFMALQGLAISQKSPFVPSFLLIDQPSRPYYGDDKKKLKNLSSTDKYKISKAFEMLNDFLDNVKFAYQADFQIIVLEHTPPSTWTGFKNFHLVEEFVDGNALIPESMLSHQK